MPATSLDSFRAQTSMIQTFYLIHRWRAGSQWFSFLLGHTGSSWLYTKSKTKTGTFFFFFWARKSRPHQNTLSLCEFAKGLTSGRCGPLALRLASGASPTPVLTHAWPVCLCSAQIEQQWAGRLKAAWFVPSSPKWERVSALGFLFFLKASAYEFILVPPQTGHTHLNPKNKMLLLWPSAPQCMGIYWASHVCQHREDLWWVLSD